MANPSESENGTVGFALDAPHVSTVMNLGAACCVLYAFSGASTSPCAGARRSSYLVPPAGIRARAS
eukprot:7830108-Alexandrium_andersonii.AAC.1